MIRLKNENISVQIHLKGAELKSLFNKKSGIEHIWQADPKFWAKSSPVLFPIVGGLKNGRYFYKNKSYNLPRHGFARDQTFELEQKSTERAVFLVKSSEDTRKVYPFDFELRLIYTISDNTLKVDYEVKNTSIGEMFFSIGAHPAFAIPFHDKEHYRDYKLKFVEDTTLLRWPLSEDGLIKEFSEEIFLEKNEMPITKELFYQDALVFKKLKSKCISILSVNNENYLKFNFGKFPYFGIWAAKDADFICLEPWCGLADREDHNQELTEKEGIIKLDVEGIFERSWSLEVA